MAIEKYNSWTRNRRTAIPTVAAIASVFIFSTTVAVASDAGVDRHLADSLASTYDTSSSNSPLIDSMSTLDDYLAYAAIESPALRRAFYRWRAALEKSGYAGALPDPMLSFHYFIENVETRVGPQEQRLSLKQSFPWFGTLGARREMASQQAQTAYRQYQSAKLKLNYSVKAAYYDYYYLGRDIALTRDNLELLTFWESIARVKYKVALKRHPDIIKAQVELGKLEDQLLTLQDRVVPAASRLRALLNLPPTVVLPIPETIEIDEVVLSSDSVLAAALTHNPDLGAMQHIIAREQAGVSLARKASLPSFTVGADYIATGAAVNPALSESGKDPWIVGVGVSLPIWFGKNSSKRHEARAKYQAAQYDFSDAKNQLAAYVDKLMFEYADAMRRANLYRDGLVPKAEQALNANYSAYQADETDFLNVLDAQRQLLSFQLSLEKAWADLATCRAEIELVIGYEVNK
ncbi:MAG: TolC family protein [Candidatus Zixiibacteriota bacterium]